MAARKRAARTARRLRTTSKLAVRVSGLPMLTGLHPAPGMLGPAAPDVVLVDEMEVRIRWTEPVAGTLLFFSDTLWPSSNMAGLTGSRQLTFRYRTLESALHRLLWGLLFPSPVSGLSLSARKDGGQWKEVGRAQAATDRWEEHGDFFEVG